MTASKAGQKSISALIRERIRGAFLSNPELRKGFLQLVSR